MCKIAASMLVSLVLVTTVYARAPFVFDATVDQVNRSLRFHDILDVLDTLNNAHLVKILQHYTDQSPMDVNFDLRSLPVRLQYGHGESTLQSLYQTMAMSNYALSSNPSYTGTEAETPNQFGLGMRFEQYSARGFDSTVITLPLSYTIYTVHGLGFTFDVPMTLAHTEGANAYNASLGFGARPPVSRLLRFERDEWDMTPLARVGAAGSSNMASVGLVYALHVDIINLASRYTTIPLHMHDLRIDAVFPPRSITFWPFPSKKLSIKVHRHKFNWGHAFCPPSNGFSFNLRYTF